MVAPEGRGRRRQRVSCREHPHLVEDLQRASVERRAEGSEFYGKARRESAVMISQATGRCSRYVQ